MSRFVMDDMVIYRTNFKRKEKKKNEEETKFGDRIMELVEF